MVAHPKEQLRARHLRLILRLFHHRTRESQRTAHGRSSTRKSCNSSKSGAVAPWSRDGRIWRPYRQGYYEVASGLYLPRLVCESYYKRAGMAMIKRWFQERGHRPWCNSGAELRCIRRWAPGATTRSKHGHLSIRRS